MYCPSCGEENPNDSQFCRHCGADLEPQSEGGGARAPQEPPRQQRQPDNNFQESENTDDDEHPIVETWLGVLLLWSAFQAPPVVALAFVVAGVGSFPPVRRWVASRIEDPPHILEVGIAVVYFLLLFGGVGIVWWTAYQSRPSLGVATIIAILMFGIMGAIAVSGVFIGRKAQSLT